MKKILIYLIPLSLLLIFIFAQNRRTDLYIRIYFEENESPVQGDHFTLFYSTHAQNEFSPEHSVLSGIDHDKSQVEFCLPALLENEITGLRLDFPNTEQLLCIRNITVSSAGVIKRQFNPCDFFSSDNLAYAHDISAISLVAVRERAYFATLPDDPYVILSDTLCQQITECYSHFTPTKLAACVFLLGCFCFAKKKIFTESTV